MMAVINFLVVLLSLGLSLPGLQSHGVSLPNPEPLLIDLGLNDFVSASSLQAKQFVEGINKSPSSQKSRPARPVRPCGSTFVNGTQGDNGIIESPNYPNSYEPGSDCTWKIEAQEDHVVQLTVFDVRMVRALDHLDELDVDSLYMSPTGDWEELQRYSGDLNSLTPFSLVSESNKFYVRFKSSRKSPYATGSDDLFGPTGFRMMFHIARRAEKGPNQSGGGQNAGANGNYRPTNQNQAISSACQIGNGQPTGNNNAQSMANMRPNKPTQRPTQQQNGQGQSQTGPLQPPSIFPRPPRKTLTPQQIQQLGAEWESVSSLNRSTGDPFLVALVLDKEYFCSGTLIRNDFVVTSAHCTDDVDQVHMLFGANDVTANDSAVQIRHADSSNIIQHPYYDPFTGANDISLIRLEEPVRNSPYVKPAILPKWSILGEAFAGVNGRVSGWGVGSNGGIETKSSSRNYTIIPNRLCRASIHRNVNGLMMCSRGNLPTSSCQMDLGSPVTSRCANSGGVGTTNASCQAFCVINAGCLRDLYFGNETYPEQDGNRYTDKGGKHNNNNNNNGGGGNNNNNNNNNGGGNNNGFPFPIPGVTNNKPNNNNNNQGQNGQGNGRPPNNNNQNQNPNGNNQNPLDPNNNPYNPVGNNPNNNNPLQPPGSGMNNNPGASFIPSQGANGTTIPGSNVILGPGGGCTGGSGRSGNVLLGFLSFGSCRKGLVYTRINAHLDFLEKHMGNLYDQENTY